MSSERQAEKSDPLGVYTWDNGIQNLSVRTTATNQVPLMQTT